MNTRTRAELALFATTFVWGSTFVVVKAGTENISPSLFIAIRFGIGALIFALLLIKQLHSIDKHTLKYGALLGAMLGAGIVIQNYGIYQTTASKSAFITGLMVIFTPIAQLILERRPPKMGNIFGIVVVTVGLFLLTSPTGSGINSGDMLVLLSAVIFGVYIVYLDMFSKNVNPMHLAFIQVTMTSLTAACMIPFEKFHLNLTPQLVGSLLYMGTVAAVITTYTQTRFQKDTTPTRAVIIFTIEPVIAAVLAYFILDEILGAIGILGGVLILAGVLISEFSDSISAKLRFNIRTVEK